MKISMIYLILAGMFCSCLFTGCSKDSNEGKYTIKGKLLKSCNNPVPVAGAALILHYDGGYDDAKDIATTTTDANGNFEFGYGGVGRILDITLSINGESAAGLGSRRGYIGGIPRNQDYDVGNFHSDSNFFAIVKISVQRPTSVDDTVYFRAQNNKYLKKIVGPFADNQIIDTVISHWGTKPNGEGNTIGYQWQLGSKKDKTTIKYAQAKMQACEWQQFVVEIK